MFIIISYPTSLNVRHSQDFGPGSMRSLRQICGQHDQIRIQIPTDFLSRYRPSHSPEVPSAGYVAITLTRGSSYYHGTSPTLTQSCWYSVHITECSRLHLCLGTRPSTEWLATGLGWVPPVDQVGLTRPKSHQSSAQHTSYFSGSRFSYRQNPTQLRDITSKSFPVCTYS